VLGAARHLVQQIRVFEHEASKFIGVIPPDCINDPACLNQPRPASDAVASRQGELSVGKFRR
jgi:hypothetical protein